MVDPFRPHGTAGVPGWAAIDLRADPTAGGCCAILALPTRADDPLRDYLGSDLDGLEPGAKLILETKLGVTLTATRVRGIVTELLMQHGRADGTRWRPLRPSTGQHYEIHLGERIFAQRTAAWFLYQTRHALARLLSPRLAEAAAFTETFNCADSASLTCVLTWTEFTGTDLGITSNQAADKGTGLTEAHAGADTISNDQHVQATLAAWTFVGPNGMAAQLLARKANSATQTFYFYYWGALQSTTVNEHTLGKIVAGTETALSGSPVADDVAAGEVPALAPVGSTINAYINGVLKLSPTDTSIDGTTVGGKRGGLRTITGSAGNHFALDNYQIRDYAPLFHETERGPGRGIGRGMRGP